MRAGALAIIGSLAICLPTFAQTCPAPLDTALRLVVVTSDRVASPAATIQRFERTAANASWKPVDTARPALIGHNGMAWTQVFRGLARNGEPVKVEGDKRAPAGFYKLGASFGFGRSSRLNYLPIKEGTVCVDDTASPAYNTITTRAKVGNVVHGENMWRVPAYRHGLLVNYPTDAKARAGSCIFVHLRLPDMKGTAGCVAVAEADLLTLQDFAQPGAVLAILPRNARDRLPGCLPDF
ncbi:MAG: hypothetical protein JOZ70_09485 [Pseudolabrys sp.]|nr:hypothetical protein [Pseudolabrys sp.]MBV9955472.1 hypothetical protein [Pseudolabrys sp.]